jgi:Rap1a immunity proteins
VPNHPSFLPRCRLVVILGRRLSALWPGAGFLLIVGAVAARGTEPASAALKTNEPNILLQQCDAMLSCETEITGRMACEDTISSTLQAIEQFKQDDPGMKLAYCAPGEISATQGATLYVEHVKTHPETALMSAEQALILALKAAYPCPG